MKRLKVMSVVGTRPEIIRLSRVLAKLDQHVDHVLVHTGQNYDYELNEIFFQDLGVRRPDHFLDAAAASPAQTIGQILIKIDPLLEKERPDALLVLGDTNSCLAVIPAKRRKIPVFHMEAGNRCFDQRVPEEINRRIVDHTSDINLTYSDIAREYLLREGLPADRVIKTGSPMFEVLNHYMEGIDASEILTRLNLKRRDYFVVSAHREENVDDERQLRRLHAVLNEVARRFDRRLIVSTHPRTRKRIEALRLEFDPPRRTAQAARLPRLRPSPEARVGGALGQRHDHRGVLDSRISRVEPPRNARATGGDGGGGGDHDRPQPRQGPSGTDDSRGATRGTGSRRIVCGLLDAGCLGQGCSVVGELHGLRHPERVAPIRRVERLSMRVLILSQWFDPEPTFKGLAFARELIAQGHEVEVITGFPNYPGGKVYPGYRIRWRKVEVIDGIRVIRVPLYPSHDSSALRRVANYASFALSAAVIGALSVRKPDVIYVYHPPATVGFPAFVLGQALRCAIRLRHPGPLARHSRPPLGCCVRVEYSDLSGRFVRRSTVCVSPGRLVARVQGASHGARSRSREDHRDSELV